LPAGLLSRRGTILSPQLLAVVAKAEIGHTVREMLPGMTDEEKAQIYAEALARCGPPE